MPMTVRDGVDRDEERSRWVFRAAVAASLLVHALAFLFYGVASQHVPHLRLPFARPTQPPETVVTVSNAITIEKRAKAQPEPRPQRGAASGGRAAAPAPARVPAPAQALVVPRPVVAPALPPPHVLHELAKSAPSAAPNPPRTVKATPQPKPAPTEGSPAQPQRVALAQRPEQAAAPSQLSQARIAHMTQAFNQTLAELRRESNPLAVKPQAPAAPKRYRMQMIGINGDLKHGQGFYYPIKSWHADGYDYYYASYEFTWADGTLETGGVPWPIRFRPKDDPFSHPGNTAYDHVALPGPLPGWALPAGEKVGKALQPYVSPNGAGGQG
jgi:outer membrane biosynthesis protein TonB